MEGDICYSIRLITNTPKCHYYAAALYRATRSKCTGKLYWKFVRQVSKPRRTADPAFHGMLDNPRYIQGIRNFSPVEEKG